MGIHPLRGPNAYDFGVRFPALSDAYDLNLRRRAHELWKKVDHDTINARRLHEGVYVFVGGPRHVKTLHHDELDIHDFQL